MTVQTVSAWLAVIALLLLAILILPRIVSELSIPGLSKPTQMEKLVSYDADQITTIVFLPAFATESATLIRQGDNWYINGQLTNSEAPERFVNALVSSEVVAIAAQNENTFDQLAVGSQSGTVLTVKTEQEQQLLVIGKAGSTLNTFYARREDETMAYLVKGPLWNVLQAPLETYFASPSAQLMLEATAAASNSE